MRQTVVPTRSGGCGARLTRLSHFARVVSLLLLAACTDGEELVSDQARVRSDTKGSVSEESPTLVTVLAVDTGAHLLGEMSPVVALGDAYVAVSADRQRLLRFDRQGTLQQTVGQSGAGPGEFEELSQLVPLSGGRLLVSDGARYHLLDSALVLRRSFLAPSLACQHELVSGLLLCLGLGAGDAFVLLDSLGEQRGSFGQRTPDTCALCNSYVLYDANRSDVATLAAYRHHLLARWSSTRGVHDERPYALPEPINGMQTGEATRAAEQDASRLPDRVRLYGGWRDERGFVGLVAAAPNRSRAPQEPGAAAGARRPGRMTLDQMRTFSTTVFIVDSAGRPVWQTTYNGQRVLPVGVGLITRPRYDSSSYVEFEILRTPSPQQP